MSRILSGLLWTKKEIRILILGLVCHIQTSLGSYLRQRVGQRWQNYSALPVKGLLLVRKHKRPTVDSNQIGEVVTTIPTIGFNVESVTYKNLNFNVWVWRALFTEGLETSNNFVTDLGLGRPNNDKALLEMLLCKYCSCHLRG